MKKVIIITTIAYAIFLSINTMSYAAELKYDGSSDRNSKSYYSAANKNENYCAPERHKYPNSKSSCDWRMGTKYHTCYITLKCNDGWMDCDQKIDNGCEKKLSGNDCGSCGNKCGPNENCVKSGNKYKCEGTCDGQKCIVQAGRTKQQGTMVYNSKTNKCECKITSCPKCYADCDKDMSNGCEVNTCNDANNMGGCGKKMDVSSDPNNCGRKGIKCVSGMVCKNGQCVNPGVNQTTCSLPNARAGVDKFSGKCKVLKCNIGYVDCDRNPSNGCECKSNMICKNGQCTTPDEDRDTKCSGLPNATAQLDRSSGKCKITSCKKGYADCDKNERNGCERKLGKGQHSCN